MYSDFLAHSTVVVYVIRADTRDYAIDELAYQKVFSTPTDKKRVIFALNCCDKIEPISRSRTAIEPSFEQMQNITEKINSVSDIFKPSNKIVPYSAETGWNMDKLAEGIVDIALKSGNLIF